LINRNVKAIALNASLLAKNECALATILGHEMVYMAQAGYDPRETIRFWQRMENAGGVQPPEFLSSHTSHGTRIQQLEAEMPKALEEYNKSSHADAQASL
jgi:predicted Zn-dependent protease